MVCLWNKQKSFLILMKIKLCGRVKYSPRLIHKRKIKAHSATCFKKTKQNRLIAVRTQPWKWPNHTLCVSDSFHKPQGKLKINFSRSTKSSPDGLGDFFIFKDWAESLHPYYRETQSPCYCQYQYSQVQLQQFFFIYKYLPFSLYILFIFLLTALGLHCCAQAFV